ncbi:MAG: tetratricopeptide repeat protein [Halobacteriovoraceae bacterium]|nr:tetratricopeptide repeat protein [Halobacteriovoraceae bacterium]
MNVQTTIGRFSKFLLACLFLGCATQQPGELKNMDPTKKKAELYYDYGTGALVKGDYTKALVNLKKAIEIIEEDSRFHNNLGMAYFFKKETTLALKHLNRSIEIDSKNSDARNNLASVYYYLGKFSESKKMYEEILKDLEYNKQFRVYNNLGLIYLREGRNNKAISLFKKAIKDNKSYCPPHYQLGMISYKSHNYHEAVNRFESASLGSCADNPSPHYHEALSQIQLGEYSKALLKFEEIQKKFPDSNEAKQAVRQINRIKIEKLRDDKTQALKYQLKKFEADLRSKLPQAKAKEADTTPAKSVDF